MNRDDLLKDGGYSSRKFTFAVLTSIELAILGLFAAKYPSLQVVYSTMSGALLGVLALYLGGNVASRHVTLKTANIPTDKPDDSDDSDDSEDSDNKGKSNDPDDDSVAC